jgi:hypothetical protein
MVGSVPPENDAYMNGYMNGASADDELNTMIAPSSSNTATTGISHHFFSRRRNIRNSRKACHMIQILPQPTNRRYVATRAEST